MQTIGFCRSSNNTLYMPRCHCGALHGRRDDMSLEAATRETAIHLFTVGVFDQQPYNVANAGVLYSALLMSSKAAGCPKLV